MRLRGEVDEEGKETVGRNRVALAVRNTLLLEENLTDFFYKVYVVLAA